LQFKAFEANEKLYQNKLLSSGLKNALAWFQNITDDTVESNKFHGTFAHPL